MSKVSPQLLLLLHADTRLKESKAAIEKTVLVPFAATGWMEDEMRQIENMDRRLVERLKGRRA